MKFKKLFTLILILCTNEVIAYINTNSTNISDLGEYVSLFGHPKAKGVNIKLKVPNGWEIKEGDRPNVVKKFTKGGNSYIIIIKENSTFFSRNQIKRAIEKENLANEVVKEFSTILKNYRLLEKSEVTIDNYPSVQFKLSGNIERMGLIIPIIMRSWVVLYEDKIIYLQSTSFNNSEYLENEKLYTLITNSVVFPDQYN